METILLNDSYEHFLGLLNENKLDLNVKLLFKINEFFLSPLYDWAGGIREIDISKSGTLFCPVKNISNALNKFEREFNKLEFKEYKSKNELAEKLAIVHCELNAIHPFREGNGRTIRLFLDLLAVSNGFDVINFGSKKTYIAACIQGMQKNYTPMQEIICQGLENL